MTARGASLRGATLRGVTLRGALLSFRVQRFETIAVVGATIASVVVSAIVIWAINRPEFAACRAPSDGGFVIACQTGIFPWLGKIARLSFGIVPVFPIVAGLLAGGPIVARELESGTARLAWSIGPSRLRWFTQRAAPILLMVIVTALAIGATADALMQTLFPSTDINASFEGFRSRGLLIAVEAVLVASVALALGAILGRSIPALVLSLVLVGAIGAAVDKVERTMLTSEALVADGDSFQYSGDDLFVESKLRLADGTIATYEEAMALHPELENGWDETSGIRNVVLYIPGSRYHDVERREGAALLLLAGAFVIVGAVAVVRRRPR
jgi:hypothetical protein